VWLLVLGKVQRGEGEGEGGGVNMAVLGAGQHLSLCGFYQWEVEQVEGRGGLYCYNVVVVPMLLVVQGGEHQSGADSEQDQSNTSRPTPCCSRTFILLPIPTNGGRIGTTITPMMVMLTTITPV
jgi:hypothetical protein